MTPPPPPPPATVATQQGVAKPLARLVIKPLPPPPRPLQEATPCLRAPPFKTNCKGLKMCLKGSKKIRDPVLGSAAAPCFLLGPTNTGPINKASRSPFHHVMIAAPCLLDLYVLIILLYTPPSPPPGRRFVSSFCGAVGNSRLRRIVHGSHSLEISD